MPARLSATWTAAAVLLALACGGDRDAGESARTDTAAAAARTAEPLTPDAAMAAIRRAHSVLIGHATTAGARAMRADVRQFAAVLAADHRALLLYLDSVAPAPDVAPGPAGADTTGTGGVPGAARAGAAGAAANGATGAGAAAAGSAVAVGPAREAAAVRRMAMFGPAGELENVLDALHASAFAVTGDPSAFDAAYVQAVAAAHQTVLDLLDQRILPALPDADVLRYMEQMRGVFAAHLLRARQLLAN